MFNEIREFDCNTHRWTLRCPDLTQHLSDRKKMPDTRSGHTMVSFRDQVYIFGGAGQFLTDIEMRYGYNDVWSFDTLPG